METLEMKLRFKVLQNIYLSFKNYVFENLPNDCQNVTIEDSSCCIIKDKLPEEKF